MFESGTDGAGVRLAVAAPGAALPEGMRATESDGELVAVAAGLVDYEEPAAPSVVRAYRTGGGDALGRLRGLGAGTGSEITLPALRQTTLADPEGNEFYLVTWQSE